MDLPKGEGRLAQRLFSAILKQDGAERAVLLFMGGPLHPPALAVFPLVPRPPQRGGLGRVNNAGPPGAYPPAPGLGAP
jgi:hypothetical protein